VKAIAVDAMGGDKAPREIVLGAVQAASCTDCRIVLVGDAARIQTFLPSPCPANLAIHPASEVIEMHEKPLEALRKKRDSSMAVGADLVKQGVADAFVSAGNTGAATAACLLSWRQMHGFHRPAIASPIPRENGSFLLLDAGASPDVDPEHLVEFAIMGRAYAAAMMGRPEPKVHLLNIGEEEGKGNAFAKQAHSLLARYPWFSGNIEGKDMFQEGVDVVVCDAFVGNVVLKTCEGIAELILKKIKQQVPTNPISRLAYLPLKRVMAPLKKSMDYAEIGGSPLLGLNGLCLICHGRSDARAMSSAIRQAARMVEAGLMERLCEAVRTEWGGMKVER
jgi:phosphate acyltransferase